MKNIKKRDLILIAVIAALAVALLIYGSSVRNTAPEVKPAMVTQEPAPAATETADDTSELTEAIESAADEYMESNPADSYLVVSTQSGMYLPIPLVEDNAFKIHFGESEYNQVHIGKDSFYMEESTCDNQNCVGQGEVTLENRNSRVLYDMVVCLPHELTLELLDKTEAREYLIEYYTAVAQYQAYLAQMQGAEENAGE